jgi:hypothetical protein
MTAARQRPCRYRVPGADGSTLQRREPMSGSTRVLLCGEGSRCSTDSLRTTKPQRTRSSFKNGLVSLVLPICEVM